MHNVSGKFFEWRRVTDKRVLHSSSKGAFNIDRSQPNVHSSSSFWASVANAPNVLQPYWLIVLPLDIPVLTASLLLWGPNGQRWRCLWTFLFSNVPTFATSRLREILAIGREMADEFCLKMPDFHVTFRGQTALLPLRRKACWGFFFALKNPTASVGFKPANLGTKGQHATSRPPKPLTYFFYRACEVYYYS